MIMIRCMKCKVDKPDDSFQFEGRRTLSCYECRSQAVAREMERVISVRRSRPMVNHDLPNLKMRASKTSALAITLFIARD